MATYTPNVAPILPDQVAELIIRPVTEASVATTVATPMTTGSHTLRFPILTRDVSAAWLTEGAEIAPSDVAFDEAEVTPAKLAGLTIISREARDDTTPAAAAIIGASLARALTYRLDEAFFTVQPAPAPQGLQAAAEPIELTSDYASLDVFPDAVSRAEQAGASITSWVTDPATALTLATLKESDATLRPLLGTDPTQPTRAVVQGRPLLTSRHVEPGVVWGICRDRTHVVVREGATIDTSDDAYFTSDRTAVRAIMRVGFFVQPGSLVKITEAA